MTKSEAFQTQVITSVKLSSHLICCRMYMLMRAMVHASHSAIIRRQTHARPDLTEQLQVRSKVGSKVGNSCWASLLYSYNEFQGCVVLITNDQLQQWLFLNIICRQSEILLVCYLCILSPILNPSQLGYGTYNTNH